MVEIRNYENIYELSYDFYHMNQNSLRCAKENELNGNA